ncbi:hypothetical protein [Brevibacillus sp. 179-C9.3 HS]|uniref:hypothetical protein n=1 Tax=unclassified Brevibacillus TaxID=2684853 RepID=UPI0039A13C6E
MEIVGHVPQQFNPTITGLNQLDVAVLLEKYVLILGMVHFGSVEERAKAREELKALLPIVSVHVNAAAFQEATRILELGSEEIEIIDSVKL